MADAVAPACRFILRGRAPAVVAAGGTFGVALPEAPCRAAVAGERAALWLGPDEWLLLAPEIEGPAIEAGLTSALAGLPHALVDVGHREIGLLVSGPSAETILAASCPIDLEAAAFPVGACTRTVLGKAEIVLWRIGLDAFRLEVARSFVAYVAALLEQAWRDWAA